MVVDPIARLREGTEILDPLLKEHGFDFVMTSAGKGSGGHFAVGEYRRGERCLELHYRWGLGIVRYRVGDSVLDHVEYMKLLGVYADSRFASTTLDGTLDGFERLRDDIERYGNDSLAGDGRHFRSNTTTQD